jgi:hypothetical protein
MIRFTLLQSRASILVGAIGLGVVAVVLAITGPHLAHVYDAFESSCKLARDCTTAPNPVLNSDKALQSALPFIVAIVPAVVGVFFGAPLIARELETGTFRLVWTQSVTRKRWLGAKLGLVGIFATAIGGLLTWIVDWWTSPLDAVNQDRFGVVNFTVHGIAPIGYAAFAFARRDSRCAVRQNGAGDGRHRRRHRGGARGGDVLGSPEPRLARARVAPPLSRFRPGPPLWG